VTNAEGAPFPQVGAKTCESSVYVVEGAMQPTKMSPTLAPVSRASSFETDDDRRSHRRYPIVLEVEYKVLKGRQVVELGSGFTLNISSSGVLFEPNDRLSSTGAIELTLHWSFLWDGVRPLRLVIRGRIIRNHGHGKLIAVSIKHYEFYMARKTLPPGWCTKSKNKPKDGH
jgi:hypothetical protein